MPSNLALLGCRFMVLVTWCCCFWCCLLFGVVVSVVVVVVAGGGGGGVGNVIQACGVAFLIGTNLAVSKCLFVFFVWHFGFSCCFCFDRPV